MKKEIRYIRVKVGQTKAVKVGNKILYPPTDFCDQDYMSFDINDGDVKASLDVNSDVLDVRKKRPKEKSKSKDN